MTEVAKTASMVASAVEVRSSPTPTTATAMPLDHAHVQEFVKMGVRDAPRRSALPSAAAIGQDGRVVEEPSENIAPLAERDRLDRDFVSSSARRLRSAWSRGIAVAVVGVGDDRDLDGAGDHGRRASRPGHE